MSGKKRTKAKASPERALAAAEVLAAVWLSDENFELDHKIGDPPVAEVYDDGHTWVTVKIHVPCLDIDLWIEGAHHVQLSKENDSE
jgi:hypothetical protein